MKKSKTSKNNNSIVRPINYELEINLACEPSLTRRQRQEFEEKLRKQRDEYETKNRRFISEQITSEQLSLDSLMKSKEEFVEVLEESKEELEKKGEDFVVKAKNIESTKSISLNDLSEEDKAILLEQARLIVEKENIERNAVESYKIKRKILSDNNLQEIYDVFSATSQKDKEDIERRYKTVVNFLFKVNVSDKRSASSHPTITHTDEWNQYVTISDAVKELFIKNRRV